MINYLISCEKTVNGGVPCGTSHQTIIRDLKTEKGVLKRIASWTYWQDNSGKVSIQSFGNIYDDSSYKIVREFSSMKSLRDYVGGK